MIWEKTPRPPGKKTTELWANNYKHVAARSVYSPEPKKRPVDMDPYNNRPAFSRPTTGGNVVTHSRVPAPLMNLFWVKTLRCYADPIADSSGARGSGDFVTCAFFIPHSRTRNGGSIVLRIHIKFSKIHVGGYFGTRRFWGNRVKKS